MLTFRGYLTESGRYDQEIKAALDKWERELQSKAEGLLVFHGSKSFFRKFSAAKVGKNYRGDDLGFHFSLDVETTAFFTGEGNKTGYLYGVELKMKKDNLLFLDKDIDRWNRGMLVSHLYNTKRIVNFERAYQKIPKFKAIVDELKDGNLNKKSLIRFSKLFQKVLAAEGILAFSYKNVVESDNQEISVLVPHWNSNLIRILDVKEIDPKLVRGRVRNRGGIKVKK